MPAWNELLNRFLKQSDEKKDPWIRSETIRHLRDIGRLRGNRHVIFYSSSFLQKPQAPPDRIQITNEDLNAFMSVMFGMDWTKGLTLLLHTPGGVTNAAETIVAYLHSKFQDIEVIVPTYAMSAGTMVSLGANRIVMGRQSQLGPIDPVNQHAQSAQALVDQFEKAKEDILENQAMAGVWFPILQTIGPTSLQQARNALSYGEELVAGWLQSRMFADRDDAAELARNAAAYFNDASTHKSHGRRIDRDEARAQQIKIEDLEDDQELQEAVLTVYHLTTVVFENGPAAKILHSDTDRVFVKNWTPPPRPQNLSIQLPKSPQTAK